MPDIIDDKSEHCVPFITKQIEAHQAHYTTERKAPPFFVGLNGVQGAGKTTLVTSLHNTLSSAPYNLRTLVFSIDDLYLPHSDQVALAATQPDNPLVQHRGQPSTHDVELGRTVFSAIAARETNIKIPSYDKSAFAGAGDRLSQDKWETVNRVDDAPVEVVIFEGWCVGFRALTEEDLHRKWEAAVDEAREKGEGYLGRLGKLQLENVQFVNKELRGYDVLTDQLNAFIHIDAQDLLSVYEWRLQQEAAMRQVKGTGMSDKQVVDFVNGCVYCYLENVPHHADSCPDYPAYELYTAVLRDGIYSDKGRQLRLVVDEQRKVVDVHEL
ncbi:cystathionine beta-lyase [Oleoguttula sp. CCFEE 5521]